VDLYLDGTHIPLADLPIKKVTFAQGDFFDGKKNHNIVLQGVCVATK
jgi:hypothetical protein